MLQIMRYFMTIFLFVFLMTSQSYGDVYRWVDANGKISYSDKSQKGAEIIPIDSAPSPSRAVPTAGSKSDLSVDQSQAEDEEEMPETPSYQLTIIDPKNDEAVRGNNGDVMVVIEVTPELNEKREDKFKIYLDDSPSSEMKTSKLFIMQNVDRGTHTVRVEVVDKQGEALTSASSVFHLQRYSVQHNKQ